jgi:hypothetical protein
MPMPKVDLYAAIRRDSRAGMSGRTLAQKYKVSRHTVQAALTSAWPQPRKPMPRRASKLDSFKPVIDEILRADLGAPRKQRHTVKRIYDRLIDEHGMHSVSYPVVRAYVADRKPQIRVEAGRGPVNVFIPQTHLPGAEAEVDFGEVTINLRGEPVTCMLFAFRLSFSGKAVHRIFLRTKAGVDLGLLSVRHRCRRATTAETRRCRSRLCRSSAGGPGLRRRSPHRGRRCPEVRAVAVRRYSLGCRPDAERR